MHGSCRHKQRVRCLQYSFIRRWKTSVHCASRPADDEYLLAVAKDSHPFGLEEIGNDDLRDQKNISFSARTSPTPRCRDGPAPPGSGRHGTRQRRCRDDHSSHDWTARRQIVDVPPSPKSLSTASTPPPAKSEKCYPCLRYKTSPISQAGHYRSSYPLGGSSRDSE